MLESFLISQGIRKHNIQKQFQGGDVQKPYGEADQERYEDDGTDRKKKGGSRKEREGVLK